MSLIDEARNNAIAENALDGEPVSTVVDLHPGHELDLLRGLRDGAWLDAQDFPPLRYAVPGLIPEGSTLLVGPPKIGKSWLVLSVALAVAAGGRALGQLDVDQRPVLYVALEDGHRRMQDRCRMLLEGGAIPPAFHYMTRIEPGTVLETIRQWIEKFADAEPLVIVDTLGRVMPPALVGESAYQRDYRVGAALKRVADDNPGSALVVNHHDRKAMSDDFVDSVSGTHGLAGAADTILVLTRQRHESTGLVKVTGRDVAEGEYGLKFDAGARWLVDGNGLAEAAAKATRDRATRASEIERATSSSTWANTPKACVPPKSSPCSVPMHAATSHDSPSPVVSVASNEGSTAYPYPCPKCPMSQVKTLRMGHGTDGTRFEGVRRHQSQTPPRRGPCRHLSPRPLAVDRRRARRLRRPTSGALDQRHGMEMLVRGRHLQGEMQPRSRRPACRRPQPKVEKPMTDTDPIRAAYRRQAPKARELKRDRARRRRRRPDPLAHPRPGRRAARAGRTGTAEVLRVAWWGRPTVATRARQLRQRVALRRQRPLDRFVRRRAPRSATGCRRMILFDDLEVRLAAARHDVEHAVDVFDALTDLRALSLELLPDQPAATFADLALAVDESPIAAARFRNLLDRIYNETEEGETQQ